MIVRRLISRALALALSLAPLLATAQDRTVQEPPIRYGLFDVAYAVRADMSSTETRRWTLTVLHPQALEWAKKALISYSTSVQKVDVIEAFTRKADGRRIDVPKDNYQLNISKGRDSDSPAFSDFSSLSVVFPELALGDTVSLSYRVTQSEPIFPGHFDAGHTFSRETPFDAVRVSVEYPAGLAARYAGRQMQQGEEVLPDGRKRVTWQWSNPQAVRSGRRDHSVSYPDDEVGAAFSTFADYRSIAQAYGQRALPKAVPTERTRALAQEIVGNTTDLRQQARLLYEWVSTKITYGGNCVGVGTVVPREVDKVLDNRMGDCKDHATLLQALLAARGIVAEQALINASNEYRLANIPVVSAVNHVINYLPAFDLYVDATAKHQPFGVLPLPLRGKPTLHVDPWREGSRTPVPAVARKQTTDSRLRLDTDGSLSGTVSVHYQGDAAIGMREWARSQPRESRPDLVRDMLRGMGLSGSGSADWDDPTALTDEFRLVLKLSRVEKFIRMPGPGAFYLLPLVGGSTVGSMVQPDEGEPVRHDTACTNGVVVETYSIELPKGLKVQGLPPAAKLASNVQRYEANYTIKGRSLQATRRFEDFTPHSVCAPSISESYRKLGTQVLDNLKAQVLYR